MCDSDMKTMCRVFGEGCEKVGRGVDGGRTMRYGVLYVTMRYCRCVHGGSVYEM